MTTAQTVRADTTLALFYSCDVDPGFAFKVGQPDTLVTMIAEAMFWSEQELSDEHREECGRIAEGLRQSGAVDFEDGWMQLRTGLSDALALAVEKAQESKSEERYADLQRYAELKAKEEWRTKYEALRQALSDAIPNKIVHIHGQKIDQR